MKISIHPDVETTLQIGGWPINVIPSSLGREPERVDIEKNGLVYSLVFDADGPKMEIWATKDGELTDLKSTTTLPRNPANVLKNNSI